MRPIDLAEVGPTAGFWVLTRGQSKGDPNARLGRGGRLMWDPFMELWDPGPLWGLWF